MKELPESRHKGTWVQTERSAHEAFAQLIAKSPLAARIMHLLAGRVGEHNAVVISQGLLAKLTGATRKGVNNAIGVLARDRWIEVRQIGDRGTTNAYILNDRVIWHGDRNKLRYSLFSATVVISGEEQPDAEDLNDLHAAPLRRLPTIYRDERQLPTGEGLPPPSEPSLPGFEPDLPARMLGSSETEDFNG